MRQKMEKGNMMIIEYSKNIRKNKSKKKIYLEERIHYDVFSN